MVKRESFEREREQKNVERNSIVHKIYYALCNVYTMKKSLDQLWENV